jgi:hypothetical protein
MAERTIRIEIEFPEMCLLMFLLVQSGFKFVANMVPGDLLWFVLIAQEVGVELFHPVYNPHTIKLVWTEPIWT